MIEFIKKTDTYESLSKENKETYKNAYLRGMAGMIYLEEYGELNFHDIESLDMNNIYKTILTIGFLKNDIFKDERPNRGLSEGYKEFIYQNSKKLNIIVAFANSTDQEQMMNKFFK